MEKESKQDDWVLVFTGAMTEAQIVKGLLESNEIPVKLEYEAIGKIYGFTVDGLGRVRVFVSRMMYDTAKTLIES